jgi:hypothetical protein
MSGPNRYTEGLIEVADAVASTTAINGEIRFNLGDSSTGSGVASDVCFWGIDGFLSRPADPSGGAAQMLYIADGNQRRIIGSRDRRFYDGLETIDIGDRMVYAPSGIRIRLDDSEQAIEQSIPGGTKHYVSSDLIFASIASGTKVEIGLSTVDVTKLGIAEPVALYAVLQAYENAMQTWVVAVQTALTTMLPLVIPAEIPSPLPGPLTTALLDALAALIVAQTNATNPLLAASAVLRASPT